MISTTATNLPRYMGCNGSVQMPVSPIMIKADTEARDEGNAAHHAANQIFAGIDPASLPGTKAFNGYTITAEMVKFASEYVSSLDCGYVECDTSHNGNDWQIFGRCDHAKYRPDLSTLTIDEFKYGFRLVEPDRNWTLISHAWGYCTRYNATPREIIFRVHQPRPHHPLGPLREWRITGEQLLALYGEMNSALTYPENRLNTGPWCAKCTSLIPCPAARNAGMNAVDTSSDVFTDEINNDELSFELDTLTVASETITNRLKALKEMALHRLKNGEVVEPYATEMQQGQTTWKQEIKIETLEMFTGVSLSERKPVTPAEALRRGVSETVVKLFSHRPQTGLKLIRVEANKRAQQLLNRKAK